MQNKLSLHILFPIRHEGYSDIDTEQRKWNGILQDDETSISQVDGLINSFCNKLIDMIFGSKEDGPQLLKPSTHPASATQKVLLEVTRTKEPTAHDLDAATIDDAWKGVREYGARVASNWSKQIGPLRKLWKSMHVADATTAWGNDLPLKGPESVYECMGVLSEWMGGSRTELMSGFNAMTAWLF